MNKFYVYLYIDPRNGVVRYVGKGKGDRINQKRTKNKLVEHWIQELNESGLKPIKIKIKENLTEDVAHKLEKIYIALFGRIIHRVDDPEEGRVDGTLYNICDGGEGACGRKMDEEVRHKTQSNPEWIRKNKLHGQKLSNSSEFKETMRLATLKMFEDPEYRKKNKLAIQKKQQDPEFRLRHILAMQKMAADPKWRENHILQERCAGPHIGRKYKGVSWDKSRNKWIASISGKHLGRFNTEIEATIAYNEAVDKYWGGDGYKNIIPVAV